MSDSEHKLMALKRAYADIILNTAKEAAARIMVSERKAMRYQRELFAAKENSLRMLLRLKEMLDTKVKEAQVAAFCQQRKIDELEAQLGEAEDIVKDLRTELKEAQDELERATNNQMRLLDKQNSYGDIATMMTASLDNGLNTSGTVVSSLPDAISELVVTSDLRNSPLKMTFEQNQCYGENVSHKDNCYFCNSDFASIVMRRKEPKLYRNGCTQRIHAFKRNLLDGNQSLPPQVDDVRNGTCIGEEEEACKNLEAGADKLYGVGNNPDEFKVMGGNSNSISVHALKSFRWKRKRAARYKKRKGFFRNFPHVVVETTQEYGLSCPRNFPDAVNDDVQLEDSKIFETKLEKDSESLLTLQLPSDNTNVILQSGRAEIIESDLEFHNACAIQTVTKNDDLLIDTLELARQQCGSVESSEVPACTADVQAVNICSVNTDVKASNLTEGIPTQSLNDKFLKYTFQRKRKKESSSGYDGNSSAEESIVKTKLGEKQIGSLESQKSTESSQDS
ncbi:uncharacterized protein LOC123208004 [Mangifera indica]|uniref:uncharacterized protein LOC123208004 n=1 Tax=Mangifera indica TaxID=29780 RepID=UPI001CFAB5FC|nr:uncharacterized protein LOC123208004 [Mangifera indica]XP_044481409.1 uncharacterized protein LOC123208004 [Mangifera indica]XP_044481410.1 uncharacterized protein LOC123208004 [Mangifera indica]XP_044481411.1 uncharacterized protein LOC123208004 [Mangifera indica]